MNRLVIAIAFSAVALSASPVSAHLELTNPVSRYGGSVLKDAPCGMGDGPRSGNVTTFMAGETITIEWDEYINHPGHYRIAFDADGEDDFEDPACLANCDSRDMEIELYTNDAVLLDGIEDKQGGVYSVEVTLPNTPCDTCTLQVIQVMTDKPPYTIPGNDNYYQCADLVLLPNDGSADMGSGGAHMGGGVLDMGSGGAPDSGGNANNSNNTNNANNANTSGSGEPTDMGGEDAVNPENTSDEGCATAGGNADMFGLFAFLGLFGLARRRRR